MVMCVCALWQKSFGCSYYFVDKAVYFLVLLQDSPRKLSGRNGVSTLKLHCVKDNIILPLPHTNRLNYHMIV